jgi:hypothetical protein
MLMSKLLRNCEKFTYIKVKGKKSAQNWSFYITNLQKFLANNFF